MIDEEIAKEIKIKFYLEEIAKYSESDILKAFDTYTEGKIKSYIDDFLNKNPLELKNILIILRKNQSIPKYTEVNPKFMKHILRLLIAYTPKERLIKIEKHLNIFSEQIKIMEERQND